MKKGPGRGSVSLLPLVVLMVAGLVVVSAHCERASGSVQGDRGVRAAGSASALDTVRPNIVFIVTDDQRADTLVHLPAVQRELVRHGVLFPNAFVSNALCCPSRASILTGRLSHATRVYRNDPPFGGWATFTSLGEEARTIAVRLREAGYRTALVGKYLNGYGGVSVNGRDARYVPPGWDRWVGMSALGYYDYTLTVDGVLVDHGNANDEYSTDVLAREAVSFVRSAPEPFFLYYAPFAPHAPATPARRHAAAFSSLPPWRPPAYGEADVSDKPRHIRRLGRFGPLRAARSDRYRVKQLRSLLAVEDAVVALVRTLRKERRLGTTMIVFTSDNGVAWGEHRLAAGSKGLPYDEATRVPLVIRYDRLTTVARTDRHLVLNVDFAPTFAALARTRPWRGEGRSLLPLLRTSGGVSWRRDFLLEHLRGPPEPEVPSYCGLRGRRHLYVAYETGEEELYDLETDPHMLENVAHAPNYGRAVSSLRARLRGRLCLPPPPGFSWSEVVRRQARERRIAASLQQRPGAASAERRDGSARLP